MIPLQVKWLYQNEVSAGNTDLFSSGRLSKAEESRRSKKKVVSFFAKISN